MEQKNWIKTEQMLEALKNDPDNEHEYRHWIGGMLFSTHWLIYDSKKALFVDSLNWNDYCWFTEEDYLKLHSGEWWHRDA